MEPGDWKCSCGEMNFKKRDNCRKCRKSKNGKGHSGDWDCQCGEFNFSSRNKCRKCDNSKPGGTISVQQTNTGIKFGDWICPNTDCNEHNFRVRDICRKCNSPKTIQEKTQDDELGNVCIICLDQPKTHAIVKCGHLCYCGVCGFNISVCPVCRRIYNPDTDLLKIFNV